MDYLLTEEQMTVKDLVRQIAEERIVPIRAELDETGEFPWEIMKYLADTDMFRIFIPEEYDGLSGGCLDLCRGSETKLAQAWDSIGAFAT